MTAIAKNNPLPTVTVKQVIPADRERVFDAWTKPEMMNHWYVGGKGSSRSSVELRVGGKYSNEMLIEESDHGGCAPACSTPKSYLHHGEYLEILRPERLVFTWNSPFVQNTKVTVELRTVPAGTEVTLTHELSNESDCASHEKGWTFALSGLASYLG